MAQHWSHLNLAAYSALPRRRLHPDDDTACTICHESFGSEAPVLLPCASFSSCQSFYHSDCLLMWLERQLTCPLCRRQFDNELGAASTLDFPSASSPLLPQSASPSSPSLWDGTVQLEWRVHGGDGVTRATPQNSLPSLSATSVSALLPTGIMGSVATARAIVASSTERGEIHMGARSASSRLLDRRPFVQGSATMPLGGWAGMQARRACGVTRVTPHESTLGQTRLLTPTHRLDAGTRREL
eukprot:CAMPEP_0115709270 /NCGR_PEP_ID=MMETSP0272-20121206/72377_1 /TAXON_ID=71861 /ORGANISM="Scrippsiella trochoidea, Strain CCMP3099" /LENGTH=241 /DNA_ID=CAMNT_0003150859 /DNA_START=51 /DNA_END=773 /DNA_ORIENTATION=+